MLGLIATKHDGKSREGGMSDCSNERRDQGLGYPRTCLLCGIGPCHRIAALEAEVDGATEAVAEVKAELHRVKAALASARAEAFEEAAKVADEYADDAWRHGHVDADPHKALAQGAREAAGAIRARG